MTTVEQYPLEKRKIIKKSLMTELILSVILLILIIGMLIIQGMVFAGGIIWIIRLLIAIAIIAMIIQPVYQYYYYKKYFYDVRPDFLIIRKGTIAPREGILNYAKLQDVYVDQDILDRIFSIYDVHVSTATSMSANEAHIDGVNHENAIAIREKILGQIKKNSK